MSCLPPDIAALAGLYGIEPREDGLSVPQRVEDTWTSANHASTEEPPLTMERVREAMERMRDDGLSVRPPKRMAPRSRSLSTLARMRWVAQKTAEQFGAAVWVDWDRRARGVPYRLARLTLWSSADNLLQVRTELAALVDRSFRMQDTAWVEFITRVGVTHERPLGPPLPCERHDDCRAAYRSGVAEQREMALACMEAGR